MLLSGELTLVKTDEKGVAKEIGKCGRMDVVGELSFLLDKSPEVSVGVAENYPRDVRAPDTGCMPQPLRMQSLIRTSHLTSHASRKLAHPRR